MKRLLSFFALGVTVVLALSLVSTRAATAELTNFNKGDFLVSPSAAAATNVIVLNLPQVVLGSPNFTNDLASFIAAHGGSVTYAGITNAMSWSGDTNLVIGGDGRERTVAGGSQVWTNNPAGTASLTSGVATNLEIGNAFPSYHNARVLNNIAFYWPTNFTALGGSFWAEYINSVSTPGDTNDIDALRGLDVVAEHDGAATVVALYALDGDAENFGGNIDRMQGVRGLAGNNTASTVNAMVEVTATPNGNAGIVAYHAGFEVQALSNAGTITNNYGLLIRDQTAGTVLNKWSVYSEAGAGTASIADGISAGSTNAWKLGAVKTCTGLTMIVTNYIEVVINGTTNAIPLGTITP